uniref:Amino acid transporter transmembrane domain-containing protein n=2 Tax=Panagrolaimus sp. JU765 TaxID=591449 RepID=A0AC34RNC6_9BILA
MIFNPLNQEIEEIFHIPHEFGLKRVIIRTLVMVAVVLVAETVPKFGPMLNLVGGSTLTLTSLVFPIFCYLKLAEIERKFNFIQKLKKTDQQKEKILLSDFELKTSFWEAVKNTPKIILILSIITIVFGIIGGGAATYSAILEVTSTHFVPPCYLSSIFHESHSNNTGIHRCCGKDKNLHISISSNLSSFDVCSNTIF